MSDFQPPTQPLGPPLPSNGGALPPLQSPMQVIQPDNPVPPPPKHGSWDDILTPAEEPQLAFAPKDRSEISNPADNQPTPAKLHDLTDSLRARPASTPVEAAEGNTAAERTDIFEPVSVQAQEPRSMFDALDEPEPAHPQIIKRSSDEAVSATHAAVDHSVAAEQQKPTSAEQSPVSSPQISEAGSTNDSFEQELEDTFAARFARYGKTAVVALALPFVSSGRLTKNILKNGLRPQVENSDQVSTPDFSKPTEIADAQIPKYSPPAAVINQNTDASAITQVSSMYGISRHEALEKIRQAVSLANQQAGQEVARILDHDPTIETDDEVGVYIDVEGGRALSLNTEDVLRVLGSYI